jgi:hypothetical protein
MQEHPCTSTPNVSFADPAAGTTTKVSNGMYFHHTCKFKFKLGLKLFLMQIFSNRKLFQVSTTI